MADITITSVQMTDKSIATIKTAGEAFAEGDFLYLHTDGRYYKALAGDTLAKANASAIAGSAATAAGQKFTAITGGEIDIDGTTSTAVAYVLSATAGGGQSAPIADLVTTDYVTHLYTMKDANTAALNFGPQAYQIP